MFNAMKFALVMVVTLAFCAMAADTTAAAKPAATTAVKTVEKKEAVAAPVKETGPAKPAATTVVKTVEKKEAVAAPVKETEPAKPAATTAVKAVEKKEVVAAPAKETEPAKPAATTEVKTVEKKEAVAATVKETEQKPVAVTAVKMKISADGKSIVDEQGNEIARFKAGMKVKAGNKGAAVKLPGCMCCAKECIAWDSTGTCIKTINSCTWDFDCNCKK